MPLAVDVVGDDAALARLAPEWDALFADTPDATGFQAFAWAAACRAHVSRPDRRLFTLVVRDGAQPIGILPTELGPRGDLAFIGAAVSNYLGPVFRRARLDEVVDALGTFVDAERAIRLVDFWGLRTDMPFLRSWSARARVGWRPATTVRTARCPYVDLSPGWKTMLARRKGASRTLLSRKQKSLARLGRVELVETGEPDAVREALPAMFALFADRWYGRHESGGFADRRRQFHTHAAPALAAAGHVRLSLLTLDGHVIAFVYGIRGARGTSSYVIAHDGALAAQSPGAVLLARVLESACARGEPEYDFSLGDEEYKDAWATGTREVVRLVQSRRHPSAAVRGAARIVGSRAWDIARSVRPVRNLKREGLRRWLFGPPAADVRADAPGLAAGAARAWHVHRVTPCPGANGVRAATWSYDEMRARLSPRLLALALERSYRNDVVVPVYDGERLLGVAWRASAGRREVVLGGRDVAADGPVYYHPVAAPGRTMDDVVRALASIEAGRPDVVLVAQGADLGTQARELGRFAADLRFKPTRALAAPRPRPR
jgi:CelD/BcsL family acetyltransferase involved in cellulose biosynthesis